MILLGTSTRLEYEEISKAISGLLFGKEVHVDDVKDGEGPIESISDKIEIFAHALNTGIANVCPIEEAPVSKPSVIARARVPTGCPT